MHPDMGNVPPLAKAADAIGVHINVRDLACVRGENLLFRGLNFSCEAGQALHITGANGTGKSSLMRLLAGLLKPYMGEIQIEGSLALCDERLAMDMHWTLDRALGFWAQLDGCHETGIATALAATDMADLSDVPLRYFSTGQRKRAALARVMVSGARIWLLDEPANGLDMESTTRLAKMMQQHLEAGGIIIAASHQPLPLDRAMKLELSDFAP